MFILLPFVSLSCAKSNYINVINLMQDHPLRWSYNPSDGGYRLGMQGLYYRLAFLVVLDKSSGMCSVNRILFFLAAPPISSKSYGLFATAHLNFRSHDIKDIWSGFEPQQGSCSLSIRFLVSKPLRATPYRLSNKTWQSQTRHVSAHRLNSDRLSGWHNHRLKRWSCIYTNLIIHEYLKMWWANFFTPK